MRWARFDNGDLIDAWTIVEEERDQYRGRVSCPELPCRVPLHWRRRSRDGRAPTFYGNHAEGCDYWRVDEERSARREIEEVDAITNTCTEMSIRLDDGQHREGPRTDAERGAPGTPGRAHVGEGRERRTVVGSTGLRPLARKLRESLAFRDNTMPLTLSDGTRTSIAEGCVHAADYQFTTATRLVWGTVEYTSDRWVNAGGKDDGYPSVLIMNDQLEQVLRNADVDDLKKIAGWTFIAEGRFELTKTGSPYLRLRDSRRFAAIAPLADLPGVGRAPRAI